MAQDSKPAPSKAPPPPKRKGDNSTLVTVVVVVLGAIAAFFILGRMMSSDRAEAVQKAMQIHDEEQEKYVPERRKLPEVERAPGPLILFHDFMTALLRQDRTKVMELSELDTKQYDLLVTKERGEMLAMAWPQKRYRMTDQLMDGTRARYGCVVQNNKGFDTEEILFDMVEKSPRIWRVTQVYNRYYSSSGNVPESGMVVLGGDRTKVAAPFKYESSFRVAPEADPQPIDWLPGTSEDLKAVITQHMKDLMNMSEPAKVSSASQGLVDCGKASIPALLTELAKYDVRNDDENRKANAIDRTLAVMTDLEMGYDAVGLEGGGGPITPAQARVRAVRRWFGWWLEGGGKDKPLRQRVTTDVDDPRKPGDKGPGKKQ